VDTGRTQVGDHFAERGVLAAHLRNVGNAQAFEWNDVRLHGFLIWTPPGLARDISCIGDTRNRLQSYIRPCCRRFFCLRALMEFAKNALISLSCSKHWKPCRFTFLRSDLFRHHTGLSTCATYQHSTPFQWLVFVMRALRSHNPFGTRDHAQESPMPCVPSC